MSIIFVLIPILAAIAILCGSKARLTALIASGITLFLGLGCVFCWDAKIWSMSLEVLSKPSIHLALGFYDGMSFIMVLLSVLVWRVLSLGLVVLVCRVPLSVSVCGTMTSIFGRTA